MVVQQLVMVVVVVLCVAAAALAAPEGAAAAAALAAPEGTAAAAALAAPEGAAAAALAAPEGATAAALAAPEGAAAAACPAADITNTIISGEAVLLNITAWPRWYWYISLFVSPGHGFQGVGVVWRAGDWEYKVWLHVPKTCMTADTDGWWQAVVSGGMDEYGSMWKSVSGLLVGSCHLLCETTVPNTPPDGDRTVVVSAVGPSRWTQQDPAYQCTNTTTTKIDMDAEVTHLDTCKEPLTTTTTTTITTTTTTTTPTTTTTTTPTTTTITTPTTTTITTTTTTITTRELVLTIALGTSLFVVVVLVVVVVVRRKRNTADTPPQAACSDTVHSTHCPVGGRWEVRYFQRRLYTQLMAHV